MTDKFLVVATPTLGLVHIDWAMMLRYQNLPANVATSLFRVKGFNVADARNLCIYHARNVNAKYMMYYDDDVVPRDAFGIMMLYQAIVNRDEIDILSAVYPARFKPPIPIVFKEPGEGSWDGWRDGGIHKIWMGGTGFSIIRMSSLQKINAPMRVINGILMEDFFGDLMTTDDNHFAQLAKQSDFSWYVHGGVIADQIDKDGKVYCVDD